jgi:predicted TPR repeat methyltransferase
MKERATILAAMTALTPQQAQSRDIFFDGVRHFESGRLDDARACFERCLALTPDRPSVLGNLGITLQRLGRARDALPLLQRATAADAAFADAWAALGLAHESLGEWAAAAQALQRAVALADASPALWFALGQCTMRLGHAADALRAFDRAVALDPTYADAWSLRGGLLRELGRLDDAAHSFERALARGADRELHTYYLAAVRAGQQPPAHAPRQYVQGLFDDYAAEFAQHLVDRLDYRAPQVLLQPLLDSGRRWRRVIDLGCGTGLCGQLLAPASDAIDGVDLSVAMLDESRKLGVYRALAQADVGEYLAGEPSAGADLIVAADVLIYVGEPSALFEGAARVLERDRLFAFTVETPTNGQDLHLLPSLRYAHSADGVRRLAKRCGLVIESQHDAPIRREQGRPVAGHYFIARRA